MIYKNLMNIADRFDTFLFDAGGVFAFGDPIISKSVIAVMADLVAAGKSVSIMSNDPRTADSMQATYIDQGLIPGQHYSHIFSPGQQCFDAAHSGKLPVPGKKYYTAWKISDLNHPISSVDSIMNGTDYVSVDSIDDADFVYCELPMVNGQLIGDVDLAVLNPEIKKIQMSGLPVLCTNPDKYILWAGKHFISTGLICQMLAEKGTHVFYYGKPGVEIYAAALATLGNPDQARTVMIGDTLGTDILGATRGGIKSCLTLAHGITEYDLTAAGKDVTPENINAAAAEIGAHVDYIIQKVPRGDL